MKAEPDIVHITSSLLDHVYQSWRGHQYQLTQRLIKNSDALFVFVVNQEKLGSRSRPSDHRDNNRNSIARLASRSYQRITLRYTISMMITAASKT